LEQILQMVERERDSIHTFVEHMGIILTNTEDPLTKELLAHLVEEEEEHYARIQEMIPALRGYLESGGGGVERNASSNLDASVNGVGQGRHEPVVQANRAPANASSRRLSVGSLIQY
jgi:hypothetical protein